MMADRLCGPARLLGGQKRLTQNSEFIPETLIARWLGSADKGLCSLDLISALPGFTKTFEVPVSSLRRLYLVSSL